MNIEPAEPTGPAEPAEPTEPAEPAEPTEPAAALDQAPVNPTGQIRRAVARFAVHEWTLVAVFSVVLSLVMTWPTMRDPLRTLPNDFWDPSLQSWQMAWSGWAIWHNPGQLWQSNAFYPEQYGFAYSDTLLGYLPASLIGSGPVAAVLRYNILFVLVFALAFFGAYMLARQLGSRVPGALVAGAAFAYAPWRWTQISHLNILSTGGVVLSLAMLARGHGYSLRHGLRPDRAKPGWALAGWLTAAWQITIGFGVGLQLGYLLGLLVLASTGWWLLRRPRLNRRLLRFDAIGCAVFMAVFAAMAYPYLKMVQVYPYAPRTLGEVMSFSPPILGFFTAPSNEWLWGAAHQSARTSLDQRGGWEALILPGFALYALAAIGLFYSTWSWRRRLLLFVVMLGVGDLAMGLRAPVTYIYHKLYWNMPGWDAIRTPGRFVVWIILILALLAAGAMTAVQERAQAWLRLRGRVAARRLLAVGLVVPCALVLVEGIQKAPFPTVPKAPAGFATLAAPVLVLPSTYNDDELVMLWSTTNLATIANGGSGFEPAGIRRMHEISLSFPDAASVAYLRDRGVRTVLVLRHPYTAAMVDPATGAPAQSRAFTASVDGLGITREEQPDAVIFDLNPR